MKIIKFLAMLRPVLCPSFIAKWPTINHLIGGLYGVGAWLGAFTYFAQ